MKNNLFVGLFSTLLCVSSASAGTIYSGTIFNDSGFFSLLSSSKANDQSGLSHSYISGVTDYDTFVGLTPTHVGSSGLNGALDLGVQAAFIDFDFGSELNFTDFGLWNDIDDQGILNFNILVSNDSTFTSSTTIGLFTATTGNDPLPLQQFDLLGTAGRYIRVDMLSTHGGTNINFGEFIFAAGATSSVPEPTSLALLSLGLAGFSFARKKEEPKNKSSLGSIVRT